MDIIEVPAVPKEAFNKERRISDLIQAQVKHLKHLEQKLPEDKRANIPQHAIVTENDAAIYIAAMTRLLCAGTAAVPAPSRRSKRVIPIRPAAPVALAAAAESSTPAKRSSKKAPKGKGRSRGRP